MAQRYNTGNQRPSNSMKDLNDNALAYDDFLNGEEEVAYDRFQKPFPTVRRQVAERIDEITGAQKSIEQYADEAKQSADNAQNIADANTYYTSVTDPDGTIAGLAGTVEGEGFRVAIPDGAGVIVIFNYYKKSGGTAQYINSEPSKRFVEILSENIEIVSKSNAQNMTGFPGVAEMATDRLGAVTSRRLDDGTTQFPALLVGEHVEQVQTSDGSAFQNRNTGELIFGLSGNNAIRLLNGEWYLTSPDEYPDYSEVHVDKSGQIFKIVKRNGKVVDIRDGLETQRDSVVSADGGLAIEINGVIYFIHTNGDNVALTVDAGNNTPVTFQAVNGGYFVKFASQEGGSGDFKLHRASVTTASRIRQGNADFIHIIIVGQSLAVGGATITQPAVTVTPRYPYGAVTFNGGPKFDSANPAKSVAETDLKYLVPMAENIGKVSGQESDCGGIAERLFEKSGVTCMASATGASGTTLANISYGAASFNATKLVMQRANDIAVGLGMNYKPYLLFIHGNADAVMNTNANVYKNLMLNLRIDYQTYLRSLLDDDEFTLKVFVQQFSNATVQAGATGADVNLVIGNAQYEVCRDNPDFILTGTQYARPYVDKDHLSSNGYRTDGEIVGVAISEFIRDDGVMALRPDEANIIQSSSEITIPLLGGIGNAVIDTVRVSDPGNYGFKLVGATITGVTISSGKVIHIAKTGVATAVNYAYTGNRASSPGRLTGNRGCIRDSATDVSPVSGLPLYNDLVAFNKSL
ncbi:hypothetical protein JY494_04580 [Serratia marcescens]|nr:hypothetical protein [Serratia marcescens]